MKKLSLILVALLAAASVTLASCDKTENGSNVGNEGNDNGQISTETTGSISFSDAQKRLEEVQAKSELDSEILLTVAGVPMSASAVRYANIACNEFYAADGNPDEETKAQIDSEIKDFFTLNAAIVNLANENSIGITDEEFEENITSNISNFKNTYGDDYDTVFEEYSYQSPYCFFENQLYNVYYSELFDFFYGKDGKADDKETVYKDALNSMNEENYVHAKHILISFPDDIEKDEDGNIPESAKAETLAKANKILKKVNAGEDFDALIKEYGEDPGMESNPGGYYFTEGEMVEQFETASYALQEGETSGLVETTYGYHIIKRLPLDDEALYDSELYQNNAYDALRERLVAESADYEIEYADGYEERVAGFLSDFRQQKAEAEAAQSENADSAESEAE